MNDPMTLARACEQLRPILTAPSHGASDIAYDTAIGWFGALLAEQLIDAARYAALITQLKAAQLQSDQRLRAAGTPCSASHTPQ
jgi:hypothetical protein